MTSKKELKDSVDALRNEVRELKTEIEMLKTLIISPDLNVVYPFVGTLDPKKYNKISWIPYEGTVTCPVTYGHNTTIAEAEH